MKRMKVFFAMAALAASFAACKDKTDNNADTMNTDTESYPENDMAPATDTMQTPADATTPATTDTTTTTTGGM